MQISDVFGAQPKSVFEYLCETGQGLYVPAYQRQYSWDKSKISRLLEDACHGFTMLLDHEDSITFIGTIIAIHDTTYATVNPLVRGDVPSRVMTIIDGQQRLTTLLLINTVLHEEIRARSAKKGKKVDEHDDGSRWLLEECMKVVGRLGKTFEEDKDYGDDGFRYYPRMIRAYDDSWSRKKKTAEYKSPIGYYLHAYGEHCRANAGNPAAQFTFKAIESGSDKAKYKLLADARQHIKNEIRGLAKNEKRDFEFPHFEKMIGARKFQDILVKADFPETVCSVLASEGDEDFKELLRLVLLANFILDRVAVTIVTAKNEDYAFDMFEALNTTGEPLTAFETFKPRVIHTEGLGNYDKSTSQEYLNAVEGYLEGFGKTDDKQDATSRLIVAFALAERGEKLSKRLSDQRRFFKDNFDQISDLDGKRSFVRYLAHASLFVQHSWPDDKKAVPEVFSAKEAGTDEVILCLDVLRSFKHSITLGPLIRFYSEIRKADNEARPLAIQEFVTAVKAITAFSVLWRSSRRSTENIDAHYRKLTEMGYPSILSPLARRSREGLETPVPDAQALKKALATILAEDGKIRTKEDWVKEAARIPAYGNQREVARFILLAAAHDSVEDKASPGLTMAGKPGVLPLFDFKHWRDDDAQTVEHISPQTPDGTGWDPELYEVRDTIDRLGNLTLLPRRENSALSNGSWARKRLIYKILSAESADAMDMLLSQDKELAAEFSEKTEELLANSRHLPMAKALANVDGEWTLDIVERRSIRIAELAWNRIAPWLGL